MGVCMYANCNSNSREKSISFFKIPLRRDPKVAKQWFIRAKRQDLKFSELLAGHQHHTVCGKHFLPEQLFQQDYGGRLRWKVKDGEIPQPMKETCSKPRRIPKSRSPQPNISKVEVSAIKPDIQMMPEIGQEIVIQKTRYTQPSQPTCSCKRKLMVDAACQTLDINEPVTPSSSDHNYSVQAQWHSVDEDLDESFLDFSDSDIDSDMEHAAMADEDEPATDEDKLIVYQSQLIQLFKDVCCKQCKWPSLTTPTLQSKGSAVKLTAQCADCDDVYSWQSQRKSGQKFAGNVLIAAGIVLTGSTFSQISKFCAQIGLKIISSSLFYRYQRSMIAPAIEEAYLKSVQQSREQSSSKGEVRLSGDARFDSPGHCARFCTYTLMDSESGKVTNSISLETATCSSAVSAEKDAFIQVLREAKEEMHVSVVTTDGHVGIAKHLREKDSSVTHNLDVWHWVKNFTKSLTKSCTRKAQKPLLDWIPEIKNHVWWASHPCRGDADLLVEMVLSIQYHVLNIHQFTFHSKYTRCMHDPYPSEIERRACWLTSGDPAHQVLQSHLSSTRRLATLRLLNHGMHTGKLENLHSLILSYAPKRLDFDPIGYNARVQLAIVDHNSNADRPIIIDKDGYNKQSLYWSKDAKAYRLRNIYEKKSFEFRQTIQSTILQRSVEPLIITAGNRGKRRALKEKPDLEEAKKRHYTRYYKD